MHESQCSTFHRAQRSILKWEKSNYAARTVIKIQTLNSQLVNSLPPLIAKVCTRTSERGCPAVLSIKFLLLVRLCEYSKSPIKLDERLVQSKTIHVKIDHYHLKSGILDATSCFQSCISFQAENSS